MKAVVEISEEKMDRLTEALELQPAYTEDEVDKEVLSYAIELMVQLCAD